MSKNSILKTHERGEGIKLSEHFFGIWALAQEIFD